MRTAINENSGNLVIGLDPDDDLDQDNYPDRWQEVSEMLIGEGFYEISPESIGALTDAPILSSDPEPDGDSGIWWFPDYAVVDPTETLRDTGRVIFSKA